MIFYVRHGETLDNIKKISTGRNDIPLTQKGILQAKATAEKLKDIKFDVCFCSPLKRAKQTLKEILKYHEGLEVNIDNRLIERGYGEISGLKYNDPLVDPYEYKNRYNLLHKNKIKGIESVNELCARVDSFLEFLNENHSAKNILIVAHGGVGRAVCRYFSANLQIDDLCSLKQIKNSDFKIFDNSIKKNNNQFVTFKR